MAEQDRDKDVNDEDEGGGPRGSNLPTLTAAQALARLREGKPLRDARVEKLVLSGEFAQPVRISNCVLVKPRFDGAIFKGEFSCTTSTVEGPHFSRENVFEGDFTLRGSTVQGMTMSKVTVGGTFNCEGMHARGTFALVNCTFKGLTRFWEAAFHNWVNIKRCTFERDGDFRSLHAHKGMNFAECHFLAGASFRGLAVGMKFDLTGSRFEGLIDFSRAKLNDYTYLEGIVQGPKQRWAFENTVGERLQVRPDQIEGRLQSEESGNCAQAMHEYALLKRAFGTLHRYEQEDWAFYRFKVNQRRCKERSWLRPWSKMAQFSDWLLLDIGCGYGANPLRAVRAALVIMLGFGLVYMVGIDDFYVEKVPFEGDKFTWPNRIMIGTLTSVSAFTSGIGGIRDMARGWMNVPLVVESLMGTLLWGLFIVAFSRKVIR